MIGTAIGMVGKITTVMVGMVGITGTGTGIITGQGLPMAEATAVVGIQATERMAPQDMPIRASVSTPFTAGIRAIGAIELLQ